MSSRTLLAGALATTLAGCGASTDPRLEARVHELERQVAALKAAQAERVASSPRHECDKVLDDSIPPDTKFTHPVRFEVGEDTAGSGDHIQITEVLGTRDGFEQGGVYLVRGEYTLASADRANLGFSVTATRRGEGCTSGNERGAQTIGRGTGTFELAAPILYTGHPHVSFYVEGQGRGGVYFGAGEFLRK